jgi:hypothetical protein
MNGHGQHMGAHGSHVVTHGSHMGEHGWDVGWKFIEKFFWVRCPMGINKNKIPHYFSAYWTLVLGMYFCYDLVMFLSCFWNEILLHSHWTYIVFFHLIF